MAGPFRRIGRLAAGPHLRFSLHGGSGKTWGHVASPDFFTGGSGKTRGILRRWFLNRWFWEDAGPFCVLPWAITRRPVGAGKDKPRSCRNSKLETRNRAQLSVALSVGAGDQYEAAVEEADYGAAGPRFFVFGADQGAGGQRFHGHSG